MNQLMLDIGREGLKFTVLSDKKTLNDPQFKELLEALVQLDRFSIHLEKNGADLEKLVENRHKGSKKLPIYVAKVEQNTHYLFSDAELAKLSESAKGEKEEFNYVEIYDAEDIEKVITKIEKMGIPVETYFGPPKRKEDTPALAANKRRAARRPSRPSGLRMMWTWNFLRSRRCLEHCQELAKEG
jgi:hypothetical protein